MPTVREKVVLAVVFLLCCFRFLAFQEVIDYMKFETPSSYEKFHASLTSMLDAPQIHIRDAELSKQIRVQQEFQELIQETETITNCADARILVVDLDKEFDGFALETRMMAFYLQVAVATRRALVVHPRFTSAYAPKCDGIIYPEKERTTSKDESGDEPDIPIRTGGHWNCLWDAVSNCTVDQNTGLTATDYILPEPMGVGIEKSRSHYFNSEYYGPQRIVEVSKNLHIELNAHVAVIPFWERVYGRFWIRAQMSDYLWKHSTVAFKTLINSRLPHTLLDSNEPYIAFHIRMTDNVKYLQMNFGRKATVTRSFERFMGIANNIKRDHPSLRHIYVATDNEHVYAATLSGNYPDWTFHIQDDVTRSKTGHFMWYRDYRGASAGAIGADVEMLRRADFLVGSFESNVYQLAAELNTVYHTSRYLWDAKRIHTVDIEWYEGYP